MVSVARTQAYRYFVPLANSYDRHILFACALVIDEGEVTTRGRKLEYGAIKNLQNERSFL